MYDREREREREIIGTYKHELIGLKVGIIRLNLVSKAELTCPFKSNLRPPKGDINLFWFCLIIRNMMKCFH